MRTATTILVSGGLAMVTLAAGTYGLDPAGLIIVALVFCLGALGIAVARRAGGSVAPAVCRECGALLSPSSSYCQRCGERRD